MKASPPPGRASVRDGRRTLPPLPCPFRLPRRRRPLRRHGSQSPAAPGSHRPVGRLSPSSPRHNSRSMVCSTSTKSAAFRQSSLSALPRGRSSLPNSPRCRSPSSGTYRSGGRNTRCTKPCCRRTAVQEVPAHPPLHGQVVTEHVQPLLVLASTSSFLTIASVFSVMQGMFRYHPVDLGGGRLHHHRSRRLSTACRG